jgi:uridine kinase
MNNLEKGVEVPTPETSENQPQPQEIERKFLVKSLPENLEQYPHKDIVQGYLAIAEDGTEVRLRQKGKKYFQTVKSGAGKTRFESEVEITENQFNALWEATKGKRVEKTRYEIPHESGTIELDIYHGDLDGLLSAEMEFSSEEESDKFIAPEWLSQEVTEDQRYKNQNLALQGVPKREQPRVEKSKEKIDIPEYKLEEGIRRLTDSIKEKMAQSNNSSIVVEIAGGSASGKTSAVADMVKKVFGEDALILSTDDYYRGKTFMEAEAGRGNVLNWDQPEALNLELFQQHLAQLKSGEPIEKPVYDMKVSEPASTETVNPKRVIIVEGLFALVEKLKDEGDVKAFVDIGTHGRIVRRLLRDIKRTGQKPADILKYFSQVVEPMHEKYIESTKKNADLIINNEYSPEIEAERSGLHEVQLKFRGALDPDKLRALGAERLSSTIQIDKYYNPRDRNLVQTGEILRIREEGGRKILTYKGPKIESKFRERPKFEFDIDADTEDAFLNIYGDMRKTITKERTLYQLDGIIFSIDKVIKNENGADVDLGSYIEIRSTDKERSEEKIESVIKRIGFDTSEGIKESYFEM